MPELPEVQTVVSTLAPLLTGRVFTRIQLLREDILTPPGLNLVSLLTDQKVERVARRGKKILIALDSGPVLGIHLGMTGRLTVESPDGPLLKHTHFVADIGPTAQLRFRDPRRFGGLFWLPNLAAADENLGPEPLTLRPARLIQALASTRRPIKSALLDQTLIAGLGNIYADEALFLAGIHPLVPASALAPEQVAKLNRSIKLIVRKALRHRGSTLRDYVDATGQPGSFHKLHQVYDRAGQRCNRCRSPIQRLVISGRSSHFCPRCQPPR